MNSPTLSIAMKNGTIDNRGIKDTVPHSVLYRLIELAFGRARKDETV